MRLAVQSDAFVKDSPLTFTRRSSSWGKPRHGMEDRCRVELPVRVSSVCQPCRRMSCGSNIIVVPRTECPVACVGTVVL